MYKIIHMQWDKAEIKMGCIRCIENLAIFWETMGRSTKLVMNRIISRALSNLIDDTLCG